VVTSVVGGLWRFFVEFLYFVQDKPQNDRG